MKTLLFIAVLLVSATTGLPGREPIDAADLRGRDPSILPDPAGVGPGQVATL